MAVKTTNDKAQVIVEGVRYRARKRFHQGLYSNPYGDPYGDPEQIERILIKEMALVFQQEMDSLMLDKIHPVTCPICGHKYKVTPSKYHRLKDLFYIQCPKCKTWWR